MSEPTNELMLEILKSVQMQVAIIREDTANMKARLTSIDNRVALVHTDLAHLSDRMDRLENRMGRVETRLDLHDAEYMPKLVTVQQDIEQLRAAYQPEPCPFCASSEIEPTRSRSIKCGNCHVEVRPRHGTA
jgi:predicted  nucleic acid-binding Zn-ribbon protein